VSDESHDQLDSVGAWAKKYYLTSRSLIESVLRDHDLGPTQVEVRKLDIVDAARMFAAVDMSFADAGRRARTW
jgi:hypothetical protein